MPQKPPHRNSADMYRHKNMHIRKNLLVLAQYFSNNYCFKIPKPSAFSGLYTPLALYLQCLGDVTGPADAFYQYLVR